MKNVENIKLILGTVQFGLNYGINNSSGRPTEKEVFDILDEAHKQKIQFLDTADAYGNSSELIGFYHQNRENRFEILTKFKDVKPGELHSKTEHTLNKLHVSNLEVYSYHSFADYINYPSLKDELKILKRRGLIKKTGISIYTNAELLKVISDNDIDVIQLPYNLLDNKNIRGSYIANAKKNNKEIHIRSVFLQGLFFMNEDLFPEKLLSIKPYIQKIKSYCETESINIGSLALSYVIDDENIDRVLIGVDSKDQLLSNLESIKSLSKAFDFIDNNILVKETELLNPVNWK